MELKDLCFHQEKMKLLFIPIGNVCILHVLLYLENAVTKLSPKLTKLVCISSSCITVLNFNQTNFVVTMVTE